MDVITILRPDNHVLSGKPKENRTRQNFRRGNPSGAGKVFRALFSGKKTPAFAAEREFAVGALNPPRFLPAGRCMLLAAPVCSRENLLRRDPRICACRF